MTWSPFFLSTSMQDSWFLLHSTTLPTRMHSSILYAQHVKHFNGGKFCAETATNIALEKVESCIFVEMKK